MLDNVEDMCYTVVMAGHPKPKVVGSDKNGDSTGNNATNERSASAVLRDSILWSLPIGIIAFDADLKIIEANPRAAEFYQTPHS